jgi:hypothetical protein
MQERSSWIMWLAAGLLAVSDQFIYILKKFNLSRKILFLLLVMGTNTFAQSLEEPVSPLLTGHYMPGFMNIRDFVDPAPTSGIMVLDYNTYQYGNEFYDRDGNQVTQIVGPLGEPINLNIDLSGYYNTPMVLWVSKSKILGATYFGGLSIPIITVNSDLAYSLIGLIDSVHQSGNISGKVSGFSDLCVMPVYLSWDLTNFDVTTGYMFYAPTGEYKPGGDHNTGLGYWSNVIQVFGYWYPENVQGQPSKDLAILLGCTLELTSYMKDADVKPGNRFSLDYGISQYLSDKLEVGLYGGNAWQISDDEGSNIYWDTAIKDRLGVFGFQLGYWLWANRLQVVGKYSFNYGAVQRLKQNALELNFIFVANALSGI